MRKDVNIYILNIMDDSNANEMVNCETVIVEKEGQFIAYRPLIYINVRGYNWISEYIAYYKSSSTSNAMDDNDMERRIRKYMWFPILGTIQDNTLIQKEFIEANDPKIDGYLVKYISPIFKKLIKTPLQLFFLNWGIPGHHMNGRLWSYTKYSDDISPYVKFIYKKNNYTEVKAHHKDMVVFSEIEKFSNFLKVLTNYCYNWKQIQYSIRLSLDNVVDGVRLIDSEFKQMCEFILYHDFDNEFDKNPKLIPITPLTKITVIHAINSKPFPTWNTSDFESLQQYESSQDINAFLLTAGAINYGLMMKQVNAVEEPELIKPYFDTLYYGKQYNESHFPTSLPSAASLRSTENFDFPTSLPSVVFPENFEQKEEPESETAYIDTRSDRRVVGKSKFRSEATDKRSHRRRRLVGKTSENQTVLPNCDVPNGGRKTRKVKKRRLSKRARDYKSRSKLRGKSLRR